MAKFYYGSYTGNTALTELLITTNGTLDTFSDFPIGVNLNTFSNSAKIFFAVEKSGGDLVDILAYDTQTSILSGFGAATDVNIGGVAYSVYAQSTAAKFPTTGAYYHLALIGSNRITDLSVNQGTDNFFGDKHGSLGPCNVYLDPDGINLFLGATKDTKLPITQSLSDIMGDQYGTSPINKVFTGEELMLETELVRGTAERLSEVWQGFNMKKDSSGAITSIYYSSVVGLSQRQIAKPIRLVKVVGLAEATEGGALANSIVLLACAPHAEAEFPYDAATQRTVPIKFKVYPSDVYTDDKGSPIYWYSGPKSDLKVRGN